MAGIPENLATRVCVLTPDARGALAVVRVWGPGARAVADAAFRPARGRPLAATAADRPRFGHVGDGVGDEVVALLIDGDPIEVEIHCHGGAAAVGLVVDALVAAGAQRRQPSAWVRHNARTRIAAEANIDLARTTTLRTAEILLEQAQGALERELFAILDSIETDRETALERIDALLARERVGRRLIDGWTVVLAGRPNVGKSRLFNRLAGYDRAIVDPAPGTTRDVVAVRTAFDGWPVELADTAGLRDADEPIESAGILKARAHQDEADLVLLLLDGSAELTDADLALRDSVVARSGLVVASKADLPAAWGWESRAELAVSAATGEGLDQLVSAIAHRLVPDPPPPGAGVPFRPGHGRRLIAALQALRAGDGRAAVAALAAGEREG